MSALQFIQDAHRYVLDGQELPSVTHLCRFLHREVYTDAPAWAMEAAAERGTAVHAAAQALDQTGAADVPEEYLPYVESYAAFLRDYAPRWLLVEHSLYHPAHRYAGTLDRYGAVSDRLALVEIKTTYTVYKALCGAQLNLYRMALETYGCPVERLYTLHLKKDGYKLVPIPIDDAVPMALLTLHAATAKRKRKGGTRT